jgi:uncharacterized protein (DUF1501 family)
MYRGFSPRSQPQRWFFMQQTMRLCRFTLVENSRRAFVAHDSWSSLESLESSHFQAFDGWDTDANEGGPIGRLAQLLGGLDGALAEFESGLDGHWRDTAIVVATEFGRTARINGTDGTDHGTATVALLAGGALKGGRVIADWPGLKEADLYEKRDLKPTADLRAVFKGLLRDHLRADEQRLEAAVFPDSAAAKPLQGLLA